MSQPSDEDPRRQLPAVDAVLTHLQGWPGAADAVRQTLQELRVELGREPRTAPDAPEVARLALSRWASRSTQAHPRVVNATGIVVHTGLGRAPLARMAAHALEQLAEGPSLLEVDPGDGARRHRETAAAEQLCALTGAEAATVVNNNAGALLLALTALAGGKSVVVSRGEMVEIGGGFRLPKILELSGAQLVEIGTTNRTRLADVAEVLSWDTGLVLRMHTSNYRVIGFTEQPDRRELCKLASDTGVPVFEDIGSGLLVPSELPGLHDEPDARSSLADGVDLVCFSGDKLLGGPQAGILVGRADLVDACRAHPLFRALRPDRLCLAALGATLDLHAHAPQEVPVLSALARNPQQLDERATALARRLAQAHPEASFEVVESEGQAGSGSAPARGWPSRAVLVSVPNTAPEDFGRALRLGRPGVFTRTLEGRVALDMLALTPGDEERVLGAFETLLAAD